MQKLVLTSSFGHALIQQIYVFGRIQTSQTGGQLYSDTSHYEVSECSMVQAFV